MKRMRIAAALLAIAVGTTNLAPALADDALPGALTGQWNLTVRFADDEVCHGPMSLEQRGSTLTGSYTELDQRASHAGKTGKLEGSINGTRVSLTLTFADGYTATWTGTATKERIRGTLVTGQDQRNVWTWTAERVPRAEKST